MRADNLATDWDALQAMRQDRALRQKALELFHAITRYKYSYNFSWLGRPIIQYPPDLVAWQELAWRVRPELIIETGIAHGGSLIFWASMLELLGSRGRAIGIDVEIRPHNRAAIEQHPLAGRLSMIEGSSTDPGVVRQLRALAAGCQPVLVVLDSNHTHEHVLAELNLYGPLVTKGSYIIVCDTVIEDMPDDFFPGRPWRKGNNPMTAVREFLKTNHRFEVDREIDGKLLISVSPEGYLRCVGDLPAKEGI